MEATIKNLLESALAETGADLEQTASEIALYAAERTAYLATIIGLDGYEQAVIAERDNVVLRAGLAAVGEADATRERIIGVIHGALFLGAQALANGAGPESLEGGL